MEYVINTKDGRATVTEGYLTTSLEHEIDLKGIDSIIERASMLELEVEQFEGVLNDDYLIHNDGILTIYGEAYDYILIFAGYRNSWANDLYVMGTNESHVIDDFRSKWEGV